MKTLTALFLTIYLIGHMARKRKCSRIKTKPGGLMAVPAGTFAPIISLSEQGKLDIPTFIRRRWERKEMAETQKRMARKRPADAESGTVTILPVLTPVAQPEIILPDRF